MSRNVSHHEGYHVHYKDGSVELVEHVPCVAGHHSLWMLRDADSGEEIAMMAADLKRLRDYLNRLELPGGGID
ncbi:MAG: hypothetical protein WBW75_20090 [Mycobacterium sp.]|uniref:hypothetical protein n=1 Tax=Mycobacterium sp. TaxID=1785 RepID=UPI003C3E404B